VIVNAPRVIATVHIILSLLCREQKRQNPPREISLKRELLIPAGAPLDFCAENKTTIRNLNLKTGK